MNASERFRAYITGQPVDRMPVIEWAPFWKQTVKRWSSDGVPDEALKSTAAIQEYFGLDKCLQTSISPRTKSTPVPPGFGQGIISDEAGYEEILPTLYPEPETLLNEKHFAAFRKSRSDGDTIRFFTVNGFFWFPRVLFGIENHLYSFYDQPELYKRICSDYTEWLLRLIDYVFGNFRFDFMTFAEDMSYNGGPMISREFFDEFLAPFYGKVIPLIHSYGVPVIIDSDGNITDAVDWYRSVGADGMLPLERNAGVDVSLYISKHPDMCFIGHFDKMCMKDGEKAMRAEFERILPSAQKGRVIISVDHQTPPDVSADNYRTYVSLLKEYAEKIGSL